MVRVHVRPLKAPKAISELFSFLDVFTDGATRLRRLPLAAVFYRQIPATFSRRKFIRRKARSRGCRVEHSPDGKRVPEFAALNVPRRKARSRG